MVALAIAIVIERQNVNECHCQCHRDRTTIAHHNEAIARHCCSALEITHSMCVTLSAKAVITENMRNVNFVSRSISST